MLPDGTQDILHWDCIVPGKAGTIWEAGRYPVHMYASSAAARRISADRSHRRLACLENLDSLYLSHALVRRPARMWWQDIFRRVPKQAP
eukprot:scaffold24295_cov45-Tisochrysis_lutea.AAC.1